MDKIYRYFISYYYYADNNMGYGYCGVEWTKKIRDIYDLEEIAKSIEEKSNSEKVIILNYKLLNEENEE